MQKLGIFMAAVVLATGMFWATMLASPPTTEAALGAQPPTACADAARSLNPWFEAQVQRRAWSSLRPHDFNQALAWFAAARAQCAAGQWERAQANLQALERMARAIDSRRGTEHDP
jgi:hypothetical protein